MKINKPEKNRTLNAVEAGEQGYLIIESVRHVPFGRSRGKWEKSVVFLRNEEILAIAELIK